MIYMFAVLLFTNISLGATDSKDAASVANTDPDGIPINLEGAVRLRDPFRRIIVKTERAQEMAIPEVEKFPVEQMRLVGVITGPKKSKALITIPTGKMFILTENARIGIRRGRVKKIQPTRVFIEERVLNLLGQEERMETTLEFSEKKEQETVRLDNDVVDQNRGNQNLQQQFNLPVPRFPVPPPPVNNGG